MKIKKANDETIQFMSKDWVHPKDKKAREWFDRPVTDYGKKDNIHESK